MIVNETKHQVLILGKTDYSFSFLAVKESIGMFGINIDNKLNFSNHIRTMWKKISQQFQVMLRFRNLISRDALLKLHIKRLFCQIFIIVRQYGIFVARVIQIKWEL